MSDSKPMNINCCKHGENIAAVVCGHLVESTEEFYKGFVENSSDPDDLQGWCAACEEYFIREGSLTQEFREFNKMTIVCVPCYLDIKSRNSISE